MDQGDALPCPPPCITAAFLEPKPQKSSAKDISAASVTARDFYP